MKNENYKKLMIMLVLSFIIMYSLMFSNVDRLGNIHLNINRLYMTILMVAPMALIMLWLMSSMFPNKKFNNIIVSISIASIILAFILLRQQAFIGDWQFMKAMIPHHSSAILTSEAANLNDPEVKELARQIIDSQKKEIEQMNRILDRMR